MAIKNAPPFVFTVSTHEARVVATVGAGREVMVNASQNTNSPARTFEGRIIQETGTH